LCCIDGWKKFVDVIAIHQRTEKRGKNEVRAAA
jgi:hypothetical protein